MEDIATQMFDKPSEGRLTWFLRLCVFCVQTCVDCGNQMQLCPICRESISMRIRLY